MRTAIIQARMSSTRLPGKVLKEVLGKPLLWYLLERLKRVGAIEQIVVATSTGPQDDAIVAVCARFGVPVYRGSEQDVLDRYYRAAQQFNADPVIRITADCPILSTGVLERLIKEFTEGGYDYAVTGPSFVEGFDCEICTFAMLERAARNATKPSEHEHMTLYMRNHPEACRTLELKNETDDSKYRVTVDEPEDFLVVKAVIEALYPKRPDFTGDDVKRFLDEHPEVAAQNKNVVRNEGLLKSLAAEQ